MLQYFNRRLITITLLGFASGLPLALVGATLQAWFAASGVDIMTIGLLSLIGQPYLFKFLWAPLFDRYLPPLLGRRRGWLVLLQAGLVVTLVIMGTLQPQHHAGVMALVAVIIATLSASQDIVYDAYRTELLAEDERGLGAAVGVAGYRLAMILSGGIALFIADTWGWTVTYWLMAATMAACMLVTLNGPAVKLDALQPQRLRDAVLEPFIDYLSRKHALSLLLFIFAYKLAESFTTTSGSLVTTYLLQDLHFSLSTVGMVNKIVGVLATMLGLFVGGALLTRLSLLRALMLFGVFQAITNAGFVWLAYVGKSLPLLVMAVSLDNISAGMGMAALVALIMSICNPAYTATQFALLSAFASLPRIIAGPITAVLVQHYGWFNFFIMTVIIALPALLILLYLQAPIRQLSQQH